MGILASKGKVSTLFSSGMVDPENVKVLRESEERYRSLVESSGFGIATIDFRGRFTFVNEALCKMIGYSRKELIGKHFASFLHSEDKQRILKVFLNAWKHPTEKPSLRFRVVHKKGHVIHMYSTPTLYRRSGKILGFNAIIADITERKQMEESLRESEDRYRSIVELAPDGVVTVDMGGIITSVNAAFSTISGYSKDEIIGRHFTELGALRANNIPEYLKLFDLTKVGTVLPPTEFAYSCKDGTERWGEAHIGFVESGGKRVGLQGILRDITERKKAERIILENQQKFERLFMGNPEAAVYWDSDFRVLAINPRFTELFGYLLDEIKGKSNVDIIVPRDKAEESAFLGKMSREGYVDYDTVRKRKDGSLVHVSLSCAPIMIEGKLAGHVGLYKDITERKRMEDALKESEKRYRTLFESTREAVLSTDADGRVLSANPAALAMLGYTFEELVGKPAIELYQNPMQRKEMFKELMEKGYAEDFELTLKKKDDTYVYVLGSATVRKDSGGSIQRVDGIFSNITERKQAEEELRRSEEQSRYLLEFQSKVIDTAIVWVDLLDADGNVTLWNRAAELISGYSREEVIGHGKIREWLYPDPKYRTEVSEKAKKIVDEGEHTKHFETIIKCKDEALKTISWHSNNILDELGKPVGSIAVGLDITENKKAQERIRESEEKYRNLFENARDVILTADLKGNVTSINKAIAEYGWKREEIIGKNMLELMSKESWPSLLKGIDQIIEGRQLEGEMELATPKGKKIAEYKSNPTIRDNKIIGVQVIGRDITERKEMEEKLRDSEEKFRAITVSANDAIVLIDEEGKFSYWNPAAQKMFGYSEEEIASKKMYELITPKRFQQGHINAFEKFKETGNGRIIGKTVELPTIRKDGTEFPVEFSLSGLQVKGKRYALGIFRDVTDRRKMEESLAESGENYRRLFESANDALIYGDLTGRIIEVNKRAEELAGMKKEEVIGKPFWKLGLVSPKLVPMLLKRLADRLEGKPSKEYELELTRKNGSKMTLEINATIIRRQNAPQGLLAIVRDVTEKKTLEETLRQYSEHLEDLVQKRTEELSESEKRCSVLVEEANDGVIMSQDEKVIFANKKAAETLNYSRDKLIGLRIKEIVDEKYYPLVKERFHKRLKGIAAPSTYEIVMKTKTGQSIPIELSSACIDYQSRPAILVVLRDIKERKQLEEQRLKLERLAIIGELATMVAHDLRNPLTSIKNVCFYLKSTCPPRDGAECKSVFEMVEILEQETAFANAIINDLLDFAVKRPLEKKRKNINNIINRSLKKANMAENVKIERDFALRPIANVDEEQLERVFLNLIKNAAQAMPEGGRLTVGTSVTADRVEVVVRDTGMGIAKENMSKIFQPLFTTKAKGIGMGLAICKRIVEEHSGTIDVESEVGKGTAFMIKLPKNVEALAQ